MTEHPFISMRKLLICLHFGFIFGLKVKSDTYKTEKNALFEGKHQEKIFDNYDFLKGYSSSLTSSDNYIIALPSRVDEQGKFISHHLTHFTRQTFHHKSRRKRNAERDPKEKDLKDESPKKQKDNIYFSLKIKDSTLLLNVSENQHLLHPQFVVETLRKSKDIDPRRSAPLPPDQRSFLTPGTEWKCHFRGYVIDHPNSAVAISACDGLRGLIRLNEMDYFIEPLDRLGKGGTGGARRHKVYERQVATGEHADRMTTSRYRHGKTKVSRRRRSLKSKKKNGGKTDLSNFCGVEDTKSRYRRELRRRQKWQARHVMTHAKRRRRSLSLEHWIEMMVAVDQDMVNFHRNHHEGHLEQYVLTITNMVSQLFHDVTIGNSLHVVLMRLIILDDDGESLNVSSHAEKTLENFCGWAKRMNPQSDSHANHHDVAVLLTRKNLCSNSNKSCETLGLAHVAGMCQPHRSCNVNQDTGLPLAFTVAHELGHNFAMHHDGQLNNCEPDERYPRVMSPHLTSNNLPMRWSACSRRYVTRFLDRNWGYCLMDPPSPERDRFHFPIELPGVLYDVDHQCRLAFGSRSTHCLKHEEHMCSRLWCLYRGTCRTRLHSAVPGTSCGRGKWCYDGACVSVAREPSAVDGSWGPWTHWSKCSRTCGVGITQSARYCDQPSPKKGGKYCLGERRRYRTCNLWNCPKLPNSVSYRTEQCAEFNKVPYRNHTFKWLPVESPVYPCELHCYTRDSKQPFADRLRDKVVDGTKCFSHGNDVCVDGICKRLGCDMRIDSLATDDKCGVCRGDGSSCSEVSSNFTLRMGDEYVVVGIIPKGASKIQVTEVLPSGNFLALRNPTNASDYYLNGNYMIQWDIQFDVAGTVFNYKRMNKTLDNITADGPITHDIVVMLLFVEENPGVNISYVMPHNVTSVFEDRLPFFEWKMQHWSQCSRTCGTGVQMSLAICMERRAGLVDEDFCNADKKPEDKRRICSNPQCLPEWYTAPWQPCSVTCGGELGWQKRAVICVRSINDDEQVALNQTECDELTRPEITRSCSVNEHHLCPMWKALQWGSCSKSCSGGRRSRSVQCVTYVINESNDLIGVQNDDIDHAHPELDLQDVEENENLDIRSTEISKLMIVERPVERDLFKDFDYRVEEEEKCDLSARPLEEEECNIHSCPVQVRSNIDGIDFGSGSPEFNNSILKIMTPNPTVKFDEDFDVSVDHYPSQNSSSKDRNQTSVVNDLLDVNTLTSESSSTTRTMISGKNFVPADNDEYIKTTSVLRQSEPSTSGTQTTPTASPTSATTTTITTKIPPKWHTGVWGQCSTTCGIGARIRNVVCSAGPGQCDGVPRPAPAQRCHLKPCAKWKYYGWTKCSRVCGEGRKRRKVQCRDSRSNQLLRPFHCNSVPKLPRINSTCNVRECLIWRTSRWSRCNVSCGTGIQRRRVACQKRGMCLPATRPISRKNCRLQSCVEWTTSHWGRCPVNCGYGIKRRIVRCVERETGAISRACNSKLKPSRTKKCNRGPCRVTDFDFSSCHGDRLKPEFCAVLKRWGKCLQPSLAIQCCNTCETFTSVRNKDKIS